MKRVGLVVVLILGGLFVVGAASPFAVRWETTLEVDVDSDGLGFQDYNLLSEVAIELQVGGWTLASETYFGRTGLGGMYIAGMGSVGAFRMIGSTQFDHDSYMETDAAVRIAIGGFDFFAMWNLSSVDPDLDDYVFEVGSGLLVGMYGWLNDVELFFYAGFNDESSPYAYFYTGGFEAMWHAVLFCDLLDLASNSCQFPFSYADFVARTSLSCFDLTGIVEFDCTEGFAGASFLLEDIDLGLDWLSIRYLGISFETSRKSVMTGFETQLFDTVCIHPYFDVYGGGEDDLGTIDGLSLNAIELSYTLDGVTFFMAELFHYGQGDRRFYIGTDGRVHVLDYALYSESSCVYSSEAFEAIGIEVDGDGCCGAPFDAGIYAFFKEKTEALFNLDRVIMEIDYGFSSSFSASFASKFVVGESPTLIFGWNLTWGDLQIFPSGWTDPCCRFMFSTP